MSEEISLSAEGGLATVTLDRPKALNALTLDMIRALAPALDRWEDDESVKAVVIKGAGEKAFVRAGTFGPSGGRS